ncbi:hypothetical protein AUEXF2481DRAFT_32862 [Aureobasidium subglaciale EXF-2481]|uniref:Uncharacterized protein n=1 Tax=Aureobasidium subglaciale (strain EXF-2481) TaxID=1043005 RepID=A0A074YXW5_AURSE|nr:uncharacterized protein AUEXF2481DRAFT_32862 [Aureobasidium subglaciale EXF-2481]KEQ91691.1 hypothetical protein AUEXF2481DRAFT_32862 [Aureobasidium subglaciale EXF-2481]
MRSKNSIQNYTPHDSDAMDQYVVLLLREEEMIEAMRTVNLERAPELANKLDRNLWGPWDYLNKSNMISPEKRLESLQRLKRGVKEAEELTEIRDQRGKVLEAASDALRVRKDSCNEDGAEIITTTNNTKDARDFKPKTVTTVTRNQSIRTPSYNGTYSWSREFCRIKQQHKNVELYKGQDQVRAWNQVLIYGTYIKHKIPEQQFRRHNMKREKHNIRHLPDTLVYQPFNAVTLHNFNCEYYLRRKAAKAIRIIVTQH